MMCNTPNLRGLRRGGAYIAALGIGMLTVIIGAGSLAVARVRARTGDVERDMSGARLRARAGVEAARAYIAHNPTWRSKMTNGDWFGKKVLGSGTFAASVTNTLGALNRAETDPVVVTGEGVCGVAKQRMSVRLDAVRTPRTCLGTAMTVGGLATLTTTTLTATGAAVASNLTINSVLSTVNADVEASVSVVGTGFKKSITALTPARTMPDSTVFDTIKSKGTVISIGSIPRSNSMNQLKNVVLSPNSNPYGAPDPGGVYVIDCGGRVLEISDCRIIGTLIILDPGAGSAVTGSVAWAPAVSGYPSLLVQGDFTIKTSTTALSESILLGYNYNPPGTPTPYPSGTSNTTLLDSYSSQIDGLIYVSGNVTTANAPRLGMLVVGGSLSSSGTITLTYDGTYFTSPPPGFYDISMQLSPGTWRYVVD